MTSAAQTAAKAPGGLPRRLAFFHGFGAIAFGIKDTGFSTFLLLYYNQVLGMDPRSVSLALLIALVVDGLCDPVIGYLSDRTRTAWGRRLPWLYLAPVPLGFAWLALWSVTSAPSFWGLVGIAVSVRLLLSCCEVPSIALVPELTRDYDERTTLVRFRFLFGWGGGLTALYLAYAVFLTDGLLETSGYYRFGLFGAIAITVSVLVSAMGQHRTVAHWPPRATTPFRLSVAFAELRESLSHPAFLVLLGGGALAYISQGTTFSMYNYLFLYVWNFSAADMMLYPLVLFGSVLGCFLTVGAMHRRWGKRATAVTAIMIAAAVWIVPFAVRAAGFWPPLGTSLATTLLFACFSLSNLFGIAALISVSSMVADVVEASEEKTGRRSEGAFFAGNFLMQKCATGLGIFVTGQLLAFAGMPAKAQPGMVDETVIIKLSVSYSFVLVVLAMGAATVLRRFPISRAEHEGRLAVLAAAGANPDAAGMHP